MKRIFLIAALAVACSAHATDGVIEINDAKIKANGGYPYTISQPGSYRLTSNLTQSDPNVDVLHIDADGVTLDLNGFSISGSNHCSFVGGVSCSPGGTGAGIYVRSRLGVSVKNGSILNIGGFCFVSSGAQGRIDNLTVAHCGDVGIKASGFAVTHSFATLCYSAGIWADSIYDSVAQQNGQSGGGGGGMFVWHNARGNTSVANAGTGIVALGYYSVIVGNSVHGNSVGIDAIGQAISGNNLNNNTATWSAGSGVSVPANSNVCNGSPC